MLQQRETKQVFWPVFSCNNFRTKVGDFPLDTLGCSSYTDLPSGTLVQLSLHAWLQLQSREYVELITVTYGYKYGYKYTTTLNLTESQTSDQLSNKAICMS